MIPSSEFKPVKKPSPSSKKSLPMSKLIEGKNGYTVEFNVPLAYDDEKPDFSKFPKEERAAAKKNYKQVLQRESEKKAALDTQYAAAEKRAASGTGSQVSTSNPAKTGAKPSRQRKPKRPLRVEIVGNKPASGGGNLRNVAMGALIGSGATIAVDRAAKAIDAGAARAAERITRLKQADNSWKNAAKKVQ